MHIIQQNDNLKRGNSIFEQGMYIFKLFSFIIQSNVVSQNLYQNIFSFKKNLSELIIFNKILLIVSLALASLIFLLYLD